MKSIDIFTTAYYIASKAHEGQVDKAGKDYFSHLVRVANNFKDFAFGDYSLQTVAILHDILEDTWVTEDILRKLFPENICDAVVSLTRKESESYGDYIKRDAENPIAIKVKIADLEDNLDSSRLKTITKEDSNRMKKYLKWKNWLVEKALLITEKS